MNTNRTKKADESSDKFVWMLVSILFVSSILSWLSWWVMLGALAWSAVCYLVDKPYNFSLSIAGYAAIALVIAVATYLIDMWYIKTH